MTTQPLIWDGGQRAQCRQAAVMYAIEAMKLIVINAADLDEVIPEYRDAVADADEDLTNLACVTSVCAFMCWGSTSPGDGGVP